MQCEKALFVIACKCDKTYINKQTQKQTKHKSLCVQLSTCVISLALRIERVTEYTIFDLLSEGQCFPWLGLTQFLKKVALTLVPYTSHSFHCEKFPWNFPQKFLFYSALLG